MRPPQFRSSPNYPRAVFPAKFRGEHRDRTIAPRLAQSKFAAIAIAAAVAVGLLTSGVSIASAATPPKHVKLLTCKAPLVATRVKETLKGKTVHVWKCEAAQHASLKVKKPAAAPKKTT